MNKFKLGQKVYFLNYIYGFCKLECMVISQIKINIYNCVVYEGKWHNNKTTYHNMREEELYESLEKLKIDLFRKITEINEESAND